MSRKAWPWVALGIVVALAVVLLVVRSSPDDSIEARGQRLEQRLACQECNGVAVANSNSPTSRVMKQDLRRRLEAGESEQEIIDYYVTVYGEGVRTTPANSGIGLVAWIVPALVVLLGACAIGFAVRRWTCAPRLHATAEDEAIVAAAREPDA
jgi:cytochrome c-type biogenesis protein CcmH